MCFCHELKRCDGCLNAKCRQTCCVIISERLAVDSSFELVKLPHLEILQISENCDIADQFGARPQQRVNEYSSLRVHVGELSVVVCSVKELPYGGVARALRLQLLFDCHPFGHRIKPRTFAGEARHIELSAVILVD